MKKINSIGLLPNFQQEEFQLVGQLLRATDTDYIGEFKEFSDNLVDYFVNWTGGEHEYKNALLFDSARSAFFVLLKSLELENDSQVILSGFTCVVLANPVIWAGLKPIYCDVDTASYHPSVDSILMQVTSQTKVIVVQHTFGIPFPTGKLINELKKISREDIVVIEDLAHSLGSQPVMNQLAGHVQLLTFGLGKMISCLRGGALMVSAGLPEKHKQRLSTNFEALDYFREEQTLRFLRNASFWEKIIPNYYLGIGKLTFGRLATIWAKSRGKLGVAIDDEEYYGGKPEYIPAKMAPRLAAIGVIQLQKLDRFNKWRNKLTRIYADKLALSEFADNPEQERIREELSNNAELPLLRYPLTVKSVEQYQAMFDQARSLGIILGDWYKTPLFTKERFLRELQYDPKEMQQSAKLGPLTINLPTHFNTSASAAKELITSIL